MNYVRWLLSLALLSPTPSAVALERTSGTHAMDLKFVAGYKICSVASGKCLGTAYGGRDVNTPLVQVPPARALVVKLVPEEQGVMVMSHPNLVLDIPFGSTVERCPVVLHTKTYHPQQYWEILPQKQNSVKIRNQASGQVLTVKGKSTEDFAQVVQMKDEETPWQRWRLEEVITPDNRVKPGKPAVNR